MFNKRMQHLKFIISASFIFIPGFAESCPDNSVLPRTFGMSEETGSSAGDMQYNSLNLAENISTLIATGTATWTEGA